MKPWAYHLSPFIIAAVISLIAVTIGFVNLHHSGGWSFLLVIMFLPALLILLGADWVVKRVTKGNLVYIWIIEFILIVIAMICFPDLRMGVC